MVADRSRGRLGEVELRRDLWCLVLDMYGRRGNGTHAVAIVPEQRIESNREALVFDSRHTVFAYRRPISSDRLSQAASTRIQPRLRLGLSFIGLERGAGWEIFISVRWLCEGI
jgi:hypothetical protein